MNMSLRSIYRKIPENIRIKYFSPFISFIYEEYNKFKWRERKISLGYENPDKVFYIIRFRFMGGLFGLMNYYIPQIEYAINKGYIPIIDMMNMKNMYLAQDKIGIENSWEYFFEQPCGYTLEDIKKSKNIILSNAGKKSTKKDNLTDLIFNNEELLKWNMIFSKYIKLKANVEEYIKSQYLQVIGDSSRVLGVLSRGTDYINNKPKNHPVQPEVSEIIEKVKLVCKEYNCDKIFLATEDKRIWNEFVKVFGNNVVTNEHQLYEDTGKSYLPDVTFNRNNDEYLRGLEYLTTIIILSKCNFLVAGNCGGSLAAMYINRSYDYSYIFNLGLY